MVKLNKIYTRTGDKGETGLAGGTRVPKYDLRVEAYGTVDEAGSAIGLARLHTQGAPELAAHEAMLERIQNDLFDLGADLATPHNDPVMGEHALRIVPAQVDRLEREIDAMNAPIPPLDSFILAGGAPTACYLHLARTVVRRAERAACALAVREEVNEAAIRYLNRLSDHLFVMARAVNGNGARDVLWKPGLTRENP